MPSLAGMPDDEFMTRFLRMERRIEELGTIRQSTVEGVSVVNPFGVAIVAAGGSPVWSGAGAYGGSRSWFPDGFDGSQDLVVPTSGLYLCVGVVGPLASGTPTNAVARVLNSSEIGFGQRWIPSANATGRIVTIAEFDAGDTTNLLIDPQADATFTGCELKIVRLADLLFQTPDLFPF